MIEDLVRKNIRNLKPYSSARDEYQGRNAVFLDANENPFGTLNRYPDPYQVEVKKKLSALKEVSEDRIFIGNGSDEVIDLTFRIFCKPSIEKVMVCPPTYGMYEVSAGINHVKCVEVPLKSDFQLDVDRVINQAEKEQVKVIFLCSPNNPTGNSLENMEEILQRFKGIVFVDEAYIEFSAQSSFIDKIDKYPNLIVSQTFSKARGLAGARVGVAYADQSIISYFNKVKPPYNVSQLNQKAALNALNDRQAFKDNLDSILMERDKLIKALEQLELITKIYPTDANFVLVEADEATKLYQKLAGSKVVVRDRSGLINNTLRITVGTPEENKQLINALKEYEKSIIY